MEILFFINRYGSAIGGAELLVRNLAEGLSQEHKVRVLTNIDTNRTDYQIAATIETPEEDKYMDGSVSVEILGISKLARVFLKAIFPLTNKVPGFTRLFHFAAERSLIRNIKKKIGNPDVVYFAFLEHDEENLLIEILELTKRLKIPNCFLPLLHTKAIWSSHQLLRLYSESDALVALTEHEKNWLACHGAKERKISVIPPAAVLESTSPAIELPIELNPTSPVVLFLGRKTSFKGFNLLIDAIPEVLDKHPDCKFLFAGPDSEQSIEIFKQLESNSSVMNLGLVSTPLKQALLARCDILCVPSFLESFGIVCIEAWAYSKPFVSGNLPALRELLTYANGGVLAEHNSKSVADSLIGLLDDPEKCKEMGRIGHSAFEKSFNWKNSINRTNELLNELVK